MSQQYTLVLYHFTEKEARLILPLAHKYLIHALVSKIDQSLAVHVKGNKYLEKPITYYATEKLMDDILKAELFNLPHFLIECLKHAYKLSYKVCIKNPKFHRMSSDTKSKLLLMRCEELELGIEKCLAVLGRTDLYGRCKSCDDRKRVEEAKTILDSNELNRSRSLDL